MNARGKWSVVLGTVVVGSWLYAAAGCGPCDPATDSACQGTGGVGAEGGGGAGGGAGGGPVCSPEDMVPPEPEPAGLGDTFPVSDTHWILKDPSGLCAPVLDAGETVWQGKPLFQGTILDAMLGKVSSGGKLGHYCAYEWTGAGAPSLALLPGLDRARDPRVVTPQATVESWAHDAFLDAIDKPAPAPASMDPSVRVIVADTQMDSGAPAPSNEGANRHGELMADLIEELACQSAEPCSVQVETRLALPRVRSTTTGRMELRDNRGDFGLISDLIAAVDRALARWRADIDGAGAFPEALALNLSIAFEALPGPGPGEAFSADEAVKDALKGFMCHGGVIFAAAGNHGGGSRTGLMYPAAWQHDPEPDDMECAILLNGADDFYGALKTAYSTKTSGAALRRTYGPGGAELLHAVGAFDRGGVPIHKSREDACPRYAALGLGWSVDTKTDLVLTGTSLSSAVASAFFAAGMAQSAIGGVQAPYLTLHPKALLDIVAPASSLRDFDVSACGGKWGCDVRFIGQSTSAPPGPNEVSAFPWSDHQAATLIEGGPKKGGNCGGWLPICEREAASPVTLLFPQPNDVPCLRGCVYDLTHDSFVINPAMDLTEVKLRIDDGANSVILELTEHGDKLYFGTQYSIQLPAGTVQSGDRVSVSAFDTSANQAFNDQVLVVQ